MASSTTQIANLALAKLGQARLENLSDTSIAEARWASELYPQARDYVTELFPWRHARRIAALTEATNDRSDDFDYAYERPSDCLSFRFVLSEQGPFDAGYPIRFETLGDLIYTDEGSARGYYVAQETDVTKYPPTFTDALAWYLAHLLVQPLRQESRLLQLTADGFDRAITLAISRGAIEEVWIKTAEQGMADWHRGR